MKSTKDIDKLVNNKDVIYFISVGLAIFESTRNPSVFTAFNPMVLQHYSFYANTR